MRNQMRSYIISCSALATLVLALWGCAGNNNNGNAGLNCTTYGCYNSAGQLVTNSGYGNTNYGISPTAVILQSQGSLMIMNQNLWNWFLRGSQACIAVINSCYGMNGPPGITLIINDPTFSGPQGISSGSMTIEVQGILGGLLYPGVNFRLTNGGNGLAAGIQKSPYVTFAPGNTNSGSIYFIQVTGSPTGSGQQVTIRSNNQVIATGTLARIQ